MRDALEIVRQGGPVMIPLVVLSFVLYERCFRLLLYLIRFDRQLLRRAGTWSVDLARLREIQTELRQRFAHDGAVIGSLVAAAPLLGLLGTVMGMVSTFDTMAGVAGSGSTEGLASGISMALITTETGLAIAIPAVIVVYYAQRQLQRVLQRLVQLEDRVAPGN